MLAAQQEVAGRVAGVMAHVVAHVRRHVRRRMGVVRWVALGMEMMVLLGRSFSRHWLHACTGVRGRTHDISTAGRQLDAQTGQVVRVRGHAVQKSVHHDGRRGCCGRESSSVEEGHDHVSRQRLMDPYSSPLRRLAS